MNHEVTRFAPSPTGFLHLGHAHAALFAAKLAEDTGGRFLLRIEDIDRGRCRTEYEDAIFEDLRWLGLNWVEPVWRQSEHMTDYARALERLESDGLVYPCFCTRKEIQAEIKNAVHAPHGPDGFLYPGTCRGLSKSERENRIGEGTAFALRLDTVRALRRAEAANGGPLGWTDRAGGRQKCDPTMFGDVVLARKDTPTSYHLSVTLDDHAQGVSLVTRGKDLFPATHIQRILQALLDLDVPEYHHHELLCDPTGRRYAKRDQAHSLRALKNAGVTPGNVRAMAGFGNEQP
ncbi:MAG: tRNA glutamyl-Q(34) synthetase GluQRS [Rhodospirillales bacterium]|nr:tRNA glutamyl-Q(34) synthetase GluQRS [Rhodospirillales bacterium]